MGENGRPAEADGTLSGRRGAAGGDVGECRLPLDYGHAGKTKTTSAPRAEYLRGGHAPMFSSTNSDFPQLVGNQRRETRNALRGMKSFTSP